MHHRLLRSGYSSYDQCRMRPVDRMWRRRQRWAARCKNALQQLNELRPGLEYRVVSQTGPCHRPVFTVHLQLSGQTFEGVGKTKQKAKMAAAERALRRTFVQFRDVEPINRVLQSRDRDIIFQPDDVTDFSSDEPSTSQTCSVVTMFGDLTSLPASPAAAAAENDVTESVAMTSSG